MATEKPGVMTYLDPTLYQALLDFKQNHRLRSLSHAVEWILSHYLNDSDAGHQSDHPTSTPLAIASEQQQQLLIASLLQLSQICLHLQQNIVQQCKPNSISFEENENLTNGLLGRPSPAQSTLVKPVPQPISQGVDSPIDELRQGITGVALAQRLKSSSAAISRRRSRPEFGEWTKSLDPEGVTWTYEVSSRRFHPITGSNSNSNSALESVESNPLQVNFQVEPDSQNADGERV